MYRVVSQRQRTDFAPGGRLIDIMEVTIETESGATATVKIPADSYVPEVVKRLLDEKAADLEAIAGLNISE